MSWINDEISHLTHLVQKWKGKVITEAKTIVDDATPLVKQIQTELTAEGYAIAKAELLAVITAAVSGGSVDAIGAAIATTIPDLIKKLEVDGRTAAKNALYGIAAIVQAQVMGSAA